tara:strand:- start:900 stop:1667 length:768 start_codon:yes stop_codon:yes gene_type:complete
MNKHDYKFKETRGINFMCDVYDLMGQQILSDEGWELHLEDVYKKIILDDFTIIDVGANIGWHTIQFGLLGKEVHAFEPVKSNFYQLCGNVVINNLIDKITLYEEALSNKSESLGIVAQEDFYESPLWSRNTNKQVFHNCGGIELGNTDNSNITANTLDSFSITPDLIKIDVEGFELKVLQGSMKTLNNHKPIVLIELHPENTDNETIKTILLSLGYKMYLIPNPYNKYQHYDYLAYHEDTKHGKFVQKLIDLNKI